MIAIYTSANYQYIDRVLMLAESVKKHHPDADFYLLLSEKDRNKEIDDLVISTGAKAVLPITALCDDFTDTWVFGHNVIELCTAVKGAGLKYLFDNGYEKVIYLDPDTVIFREMTEILDALDDYNCVLTPHMTVPSKRQELKVIEHACFRHGVYNLGFGAWKNTEEGRRIADWWHNNLYKNCYEEPWNSLYTDQKFFDLAPAIFERVCVLRDTTYNVATWNLEHRYITKDGETILVDGRPLSMFHFAGSVGRGKGNFDRWYGDTLPIVEALWGWYVARRSAWIDQKPAWSYASYDDGVEIEYDDRVYFRCLSASAKKDIKKPFSADWKNTVNLKQSNKFSSSDAASLQVMAIKAELATLKASLPIRISRKIQNLFPAFLINWVRRVLG